MPRRKLNYREGDWFAVPLRDYGYAVGVVARASRGCVFGYFFRPRCENIPALDDIIVFQPKDAVWRAMFGDLGLLEEKWPIIGHSVAWDRSAWPLPPFVRIDVLNPQKAYKTRYSEDDISLNGIIEIVDCDPGLVAMYPEDSVSGYGAIEIKLTDLLSKYDH